MREGDYEPAPPIPGTIVVNIGDLMQRWTADKLIATVSCSLSSHIIYPGFLNV